MKLFSTLIVLIACSLGFTKSSSAQIQLYPKYENRAVFVATVYKLDWPSISATRFQKTELVEIFDKYKAAGINSVYFQIRTACDALYNSNYEPWSSYLTGEQGKAPDPYYDPLELAIQLAHERGMELHAWMNPYRALTNISSKSVSENNEIYDVELLNSNSLELEKAMAASSSPSLTSKDHVSVTHPEWLITTGKNAILDPGLPEVIKYITDVVMDVVNRYDVDGVHFDDYFYPYPPDTITKQDDSTFAKYPRGFTNRGDWRRNNINMMIESVYDSILTVKPHVKYGISPFGIWKSGIPESTSGMSAYSEIYADAVTWLNEHTVDYIAPQLYWPFSRGLGQDYGVLANWWGSVRNGRHVYTSQGLYRTDGNTFSGVSFSANEIPSQVRFMRKDANLLGSVFFRAKNISEYYSKGFTDSLKLNLYTRPAIQPKMAWKVSPIPATPQNLAFTIDKTNPSQDKVNLTWSKVNYANNLDTLVKYAVYRVTAAQKPSADTVITNVKYLLAVTGLTNYTDANPGGMFPNWYFVTAINRNADESANSTIVQTDVLTTSIEENTQDEIPDRLSLAQNFPNPFNPSTTISFSVDKNEQIQLQVFDMLGREVALLASGMFTKGNHSIRFDASALSSGLYFYTLKSSEYSITKKMVLLK